VVGTSVVVELAGGFVVIGGAVVVVVVPAVVLVPFVAGVGGGVVGGVVGTVGVGAVVVVVAAVVVVVVLSVTVGQSANLVTELSNSTTWFPHLVDPVSFMTVKKLQVTFSWYVTFKHSLHDDENFAHISSVVSPEVSTRPDAIMSTSAPATNEVLEIAILIRLL